jgi:SAM-dependent methyltransferase
VTGTDVYGDYILTTGGGIEDWEEAFGSYLHGSRFHGRAPVLDIGPGRCWFTRQDPENVVALDNQQAIVDRYSAQGLNIVHGSVYEIPFEDATFDGVFSCWLFEHLDDPAAAIREVARVTRPGGYVCLIVPSDRALLRGFYDDYTHVRPFTAASLRELGRAGGFSSVRVENLFWTGGLGRLGAGPAKLERLFKFADEVARRLRIVNRYNLVFEGWK